jgi:hypothetical protein
LLPNSWPKDDAPHGGVSRLVDIVPMDLQVRSTRACISRPGKIHCERTMTGMVIRAADIVKALRYRPGEREVLRGRIVCVPEISGIAWSRTRSRTA